MAALFPAACIAPSLSTKGVSTLENTSQFALELARLTYFSVITWHKVSGNLFPTFFFLTSNPDYFFPAAGSVSLFPTTTIWKVFCLCDRLLRSTKGPGSLLVLQKDFEWFSDDILRSWGTMFWDSSNTDPPQSFSLVVLKYFFFSILLLLLLQKTIDSCARSLI